MQKYKVLLHNARAIELDVWAKDEAEAKELGNEYLFDSHVYATGQIIQVQERQIVESSEVVDVQPL